MGFIKKIKTMNIKNKQDFTIYDFTGEVEKKIKEIYPTKELQEKALLLIYLINRADGLGYQINVRNHRAFFGNLNGLKWKQLFQPLLTNNLILCTSPHEVGTKSKTYTTTKQYKWDVTQGEIKRRFYGEEYNSMPEYIQKFHLDKHLVVNPQKSLWSENYQYITKDTITEEERETMNELKLEIKMLKEMMELMQLNFNQKIESLENEIKKPTQKEVKTIEESHHGEIPTKNETIEDLNIYQKFVQEQINNGILNFSEIYNLTSNQFVDENTPEEVANQLYFAIYECVEERFDKNNLKLEINDK